jgi:hypothetical protein
MNDINSDFKVEKYGFSPLDEVVLKVDIPVGFSGSNNLFVKLDDPKVFIITRVQTC